MFSESPAGTIRQTWRADGQLTRSCGTSEPIDAVAEHDLDAPGLRLLGGRLEKRPHLALHARERPGLGSDLKHSRRRQNQ